MKKNKYITIFTATYNREKLITRLYKSLQQQSVKDFEWIIVDDGSEDDTEIVVSNMIKTELSFPIFYYKQQNQGKHVAINKGLEHANSDFFYIVDSDDRLPKNAIKELIHKAKTVIDKKHVAGVVGLKCFFDGTPVGSNNLKEDITCNSFDFRYKYGVTGDKAELFKTEVLRKFNFPQFKEETFLPESIVWNRIAKDYQMLYFNKNVYECEYLQEGLSAHSVALRKKNPLGVLNLYSELMGYNIPKKVKIKAYVNFWRFFFCLPVHKYAANSKLLKLQVGCYLFLPVGFAYYIIDKVKGI